MIAGLYCAIALDSKAIRRAGTTLLALMAVLCICEPSLATVHGDVNELLKQSDAWFNSAQGHKTIENIVTWQNANGGWWKKYDPSIERPRVLPPASSEDAAPGDTEEVWRRTSTFDNGAT